MSKHKSNVHPGYYKVAGRERQGEDIVHDRQKSMLTQNRADLEHREPYPQWPAPTEKKPMPEKDTLERALQDKQQGKSASTQAIGLSKARGAGVKLATPSRGSKSTRRKASQDASQDAAKGRQPGRKPSPKRARAARKALKREGRSAASRSALARQARSSARRTRARG